MRASERSFKNGCDDSCAQLLLRCILLRNIEQIAKRDIRIDRRLMLVDVQLEVKEKTCVIPESHEDPAGAFVSLDGCDLEIIDIRVARSIENVVDLEQVVLVLADQREDSAIIFVIDITHNEKASMISERDSGSHRTYLPLK